MIFAVGGVIIITAQKTNHRLWKSNVPSQHVFRPLLTSLGDKIGSILKPLPLIFHFRVPTYQFTYLLDSSYIVVTFFVFTFSHKTPKSQTTVWYAWLGPLLVYNEWRNPFTMHLYAFWYRTFPPHSPLTLCSALNQRLSSSLAFTPIVAPVPSKVIHCSKASQGATIFPFTNPNSVIRVYTRHVVLTTAKIWYEIIMTINNMSISQLRFIGNWNMFDIMHLVAVVNRASIPIDREKNILINTHKHTHAAGS